MSKSNTIKNLEKTYKFSIDRSKGDRFTDIIKFEDGRQYRLRLPFFMEFHQMFSGSDNLDHDVFLYGISNLKPDNKQSPAIDEDYLENNRSEALGLWSPLLRNRIILGQ